LILIDSSAFIEFLNRTGSPCDLAVERLLRDDIDCAIADIILTELLQGIKNDREFRAVRDSLLNFPILSLKGVASYVQAGELYRRCRQNGLTIRSTVDLLIAQTALDHDAALLHNDRDFVSIASVSPLKLYQIM
jgi:hypothetical protein